MPLTSEERDRLRSAAGALVDALDSLSAEDEPAPEQVAEAVAEASAETAEAVADAVAEAVADAAPVIEPIEGPSTEEIVAREEAFAVGQAIQTQAEADAAEQIIEAQTEAQVAIIEAQADAEAHVAEAIAEATPPPPKDEAPRQDHWFFRDLFGSRR